MSFWFTSLFRSSPVEVFSCPFAFALERLPSFYNALLLAWHSLKGAFCVWSLVPSQALKFPLFWTFRPNPTICFFYLDITSLLIVSPNFVPNSGTYTGPPPGNPYPFPSFFLDRPVFYFAWKIAHRVLYTADRLVSFGYNVPPLCLCGLAPETLQHLFFACALAQSVLSWLQSLMVNASPLCLSLLCCHVLFGFNPD